MMITSFVCCFIVFYIKCSWLNLVHWGAQAWHVWEQVPVDSKKIGFHRDA